MSKFMVLVQNPRSKAYLAFQDEEAIQTWDSADAAWEAVKTSPVVEAWGCEVIEIGKGIRVL